MKKYQMHEKIRDQILSFQNVKDLKFSLEWL